MDNVLFILADDLGAWALGCAGNNEIHTPHLDRLAARGLRLENAFCVSPVCSPARASLLTGRIPSQHGVHDWVRRGNCPSESGDGSLIDYLEGLPTYTEALAQAGYRCGLSGKWHLGQAPVPRGDHVFWHVHAKGGGSYYHAPWIRDGQECEAPGYVTDVITDYALEFLEAYADGARPFYLGVHYTAPHYPWGRDQHPAQYYEPYFNDCAFESVPELPMHPWQIDTAPRVHTREARREMLSGYYAAVTAMDAAIGRLLDALERSGQLGRTLIVFTSDNGMNMGHHGIYGKGNGTYPQNMYDTSVKVPFILSRPGRVPEGVSAGALFSHYDFMPTLLDFLGLGRQVPAALPGAIRTDLWEGRADATGAPVVVFDEYGPVRMIRDERWKYVHRFPDGPHECYDLQSDPGETHNLIGDPRCFALAERMRGQLAAWFARYVDPARDGADFPVTGKGQCDLSGRAGAFADDWFYYSENVEPKDSAS
ncbi:sulfatase-like hydrolase/transferase [Ruficoccus amylovorans]|uniref:Sulfatase-like hydrolase/transferase n=1 Tax=Ruficoccus amylovorans TaxID=1804625 RepID=A0A842HGR7_9BACT|nr:sulfatase-like hydrolase/transferase [Ruficoccus amylovorans]MBC2595905.1 sulfatase-like hydrolase/transferase [Ruficoccus amylovorans]